MPIMEAVCSPLEGPLHDLAHREVIFMTRPEPTATRSSGMMADSIAGENPSMYGSAISAVIVLPDMTFVLAGRSDGALAKSR